MGKKALDVLTEKVGDAPRRQDVAPPLEGHLNGLHKPTQRTVASLGPGYAAWTLQTSSFSQ